MHITTYTVLVTLARGTTQPSLHPTELAQIIQNHLECPTEGTPVSSLAAVDAFLGAQHIIAFDRDTETALRVHRAIRGDCGRG